MRCRPISAAARWSVAFRSRKAAQVLALLLCLSWPAGAAGGTPALIELKVAGTAYRGKVLHVGQNSCWFVEQDGRLHQFALKDLSRPVTLAPRFRGLSTADLRDQLAREFGREFEVHGTGHYLVCAARGTADQYADIFEKVYRSFHGYFASRGFTVAQPEFPLVAIVFPDRAAFVAYCRQDGVQAGPGLQGYYLNTTNRVALYDSRSGGGQTSSLEPQPLYQSLTAPEDLAAAFSPSSAGPLLLPGRETSARQAHHIAFRRPFVAALATAGDLEDTIVHETTHQVAFNTGVHSRTGRNPLWVVEGLATVFESPGVRDSAGGRSSAAGRINRSRYLWFRNYARQRRKPRSLESFIASDHMLRTATLDFYSQAWALSYFLMETRPAAYNRYLKVLADRDPLAAYSPTDRLDDFREVFGSSLDRLETEMLRFLERIDP